MGSGVAAPGISAIFFQIWSLEEMPYLVSLDTYYNLHASIQYPRGPGALAPGSSAVFQIWVLGDAISSILETYQHSIHVPIQISNFKSEEMPSVKPF